MSYLWDPLHKSDVKKGNFGADLPYMNRFWPSNTFLSPNVMCEPHATTVMGSFSEIRSIACCEFWLYRKAKHTSLLRGTPFLRWCNSRWEKWRSRTRESSCPTRCPWPRSSSWRRPPRRRGRWSSWDAEDSASCCHSGRRKNHGLQNEVWRYRVNHTVRYKRSIQGRYGCYIGPESSVCIWPYG